MIRNIIRIMVIVGILGSSTVEAFFPLNIFQAYDLNTYRPNRWRGTFVDVGVTGEFGLRTFGRSAMDEPCDPPKKGEEVNVLQVWQEQQDALAMLRGFCPASEIGLLAQQLEADNDNGVRGRFVFCGDLDIRANLLFSSRWYLPLGFIAGLYVPVRSLHLAVNFKDLTHNNTSEDILTKQLLTDNFAARVQDLGGLSIAGWQRMGFGDLVALMHWRYDFPQEKPLLKNVRVNTRAGLSFPTGKKADQDQIMSIPLGNDGAWGIIFGGGLDLTLGAHVKAGVDVEFLQLFSVIRNFRIKTDVDQTDLLLLAKACALKDFGFTHRFNLYAQIYDLPKGLSLDVVYQFWKQEDSKLALFGNAFSSEVANTAKSLEEWTMHHMIFKLNYDFESVLRDSWFKPYMAFFYKHPINGKNAILADTVGFELSLSF